MTSAMYPGTFDPVTNGHADLVRRALRIFDEVIVAVASNPNKAPMFTLDERVEMAEEVLMSLGKVRVMGYSGLTIEFARHNATPVMLRGLRAVSDFEFEFQLATMSRQLSPNVETVFLTPSAELSFISSSMVREIGILGGDVSEFVHPLVAERLSSRAAARQQPT
ncbi:MAG: pantetheine-phosphate adenylyltransferase [Pseudomonadota bacterium]